MGLSDFTPEERIVAEWILENIDDNGYLAYPLEEISAASNVPVEDLERILLKVQKLDPPGVGARDLRECILIQHRATGDKDPILEDFILKYFDLVEKSNIKDIMKKTGYPMELVRSIVERIKNFDPKPGRNFGDDSVFYVIPDAVCGEERRGI